MKKLIALSLVLSIIFAGCSLRRTADCEQLLLKMLIHTEGASRENGSIFLQKAEEGSIEYFSDENKAILYGDKAVEYSFEKIEDFAIFISARFPEEIAIFKCYSSSDTSEVAKMCLLRADKIKVALKGTEWEEKSTGIRVSVHKRFVIMSFTDQPQMLEDKLRALI